MFDWKYGTNLLNIAVIYLFTISWREVCKSLIIKALYQGINKNNLLGGQVWDFNPKIKENN